MHCPFYVYTQSGTGRLYFIPSGAHFIVMRVRTEIKELERGKRRDWRGYERGEGSHAAL